MFFARRTRRKTRIFFCVFCVFCRQNSDVQWRGSQQEGSHSQKAARRRTAGSQDARRVRIKGSSEASNIEQALRCILQSETDSWQSPAGSFLQMAFASFSSTKS